jgi:thiamine kinase-like enzyme
MENIESLKEINSTWLAEALKIEKEKIKQINVRYLGDMPISHAAVVNIEYVTEELYLPKSVFIKITNINIRDKLIGIGRKEVEFYNNIGGEIGLEYIPKKYYAFYDESKNLYNIVLEDLSLSHFQTEYPIPPKIEYCKLAIESLAKIHSKWWDNPELDKVTTKFRTREDNVSLIMSLREKVDRFIEFLGDRLVDEKITIFQNVLNILPTLDERYFSYTNITLNHGDAHYWNFLFPKIDAGKIKIIDWDSYTNGLGATDLAYMLALHWFPDRRTKYEKELLEFYYMQLIQNGIENYSYSDFMYDYKWSIIHLMFLPVLQWNNKSWAGIWFNHLERIFSAYEDLKCNELIQHRK